MFENTELTMVLAKTKDGIIGTTSGKLPWKCSDDMKWFKNLTENKVIIMGRTTYESIGKLLPNRTTYILSKTLKNEDIINNNDEGSFVICSNLTELSYLLEQHEVEDAFVLGGLNVYQQMLPYCTHFFITNIHDDYCLFNNVTPVGNNKEFGDFIHANKLLAEIEVVTYRSKCIRHDLPTDLNVTVGFRTTDTPRSTVIGEKTREVMKKLISEKRVMFPHNRDMTDEHLLELFEHRLSNKYIVVSVDALPLNAAHILLPYFTLVDSMRCEDPIHSLDTLGLEWFHFDTLSMGWNVLLLSKSDGEILLTDLLDRPERHLSDEIELEFDIDEDLISLFMDGYIELYNEREHMFDKGVADGKEE